VEVGTRATKDDLARDRDRSVVSDTSSRAITHREAGTDMAEAEYVAEGETGAPEGREPERGEDSRGRQ